MEQSGSYSEFTNDPTRALIDEQYEIVNGIRYDLKPSPSTGKRDKTLKKYITMPGLESKSIGLLIRFTRPLTSFS